MDLYKRVLELTDVNLIRCLPGMILTLVIYRIILSNRSVIKTTFQLVRWMIILYTFAALIFFIVENWLMDKNFVFPQPSAGGSTLVYGLLFTSAFILPLTLFFRKPGESPAYLLWIAIMIKIGWYFEQWVIISTSYSREFSPNPKYSLWYIVTDIGILSAGIQSVVLGLMCIGIVAYWEKQRQR